MFDLTGKKALVTGASRGIGRGIALSLAKAGADVIVNYHSNAQQAEEAVSSIKALGKQSFAIQADVSVKAEVERMFGEIKNKWGNLDILVNNAGVLNYAPFAQLTDEQWDSVIDTNLKGQFMCAREAVKLIVGKGRIINIASIASGGVGVGYAQLAHYTASKGGVIGMTEAMAVDLGPNINVNAIAPGAIETDMAKGVTENEQVKAGLLAKLPKKRLGQPEDIGAAGVFLASDEADYITGVTLNVDGGWLAG